MFSDRDYNRRTVYRGGFGGYRQSSILRPLIIANIAVFILQSLSPGLTGLLSLNFGDLRQFQVWRLGTYMFAHGNFFHILLNMWGLYIFGAPLEQQIGPHRLLRLYFVSGLIGGIIWLVFNASQIQVAPGIFIYPSVIGASGSVFGTMMAAAMLAPNRQYMLLFPPIPMRLKTLVTVYAALEIYNTLQRAEGGRVAHLAHLGGLIGGYLFVVYAVPGWRGFKLHRFLLDRIRHWRLRWRWARFRSVSSRQSFDQDDDDYGDDEITLDDILDKIGRDGLSSLTPRERRILQEARERLRGKH